MDNGEHKSGEDLVKDMDNYQVSRWIALYEAVNLIADNAEKSGKRIDSMILKKTPLTEYIDSTSDIIYRNLTGKVTTK